jgi:hypothetical protein
MRGRLMKKKDRTLVRRVTALIAMTAILATGPDSVAEADKDRLSGRGVVFGAFVQDSAGGSLIDAQRRFERMIGRKLTATRVYLRWDSAFPNRHVEWLKRRNRTIVLSVRAMREDGSIVPWRSIADAAEGSDLYDTIVSWARRIGAFNQHIYLIFNHEPEARSNDSLGSSSDFIAAWRRIVGVFRQEGTQNVSWTWTMTSWAFETTDERAADNWYPGDDVVDVIGADVYNFSDCATAGRPWYSFRRNMLPIRAWAEAHPGLPIILPEWATTSDPQDVGRKASWIRDARRLLKKPAWRRIKMVLYFQTIDPSLPGCMWPVTVADGSARALGAMAADPYFSARG